MLATRFSRNRVSTYSNTPLSDEQIRKVAPSIFSEAAHESRSERYTHIPTIDVLKGLRKEGFEPFMVCQTRVRVPGKHEHTKHLMRLRHASQITAKEANEIILLNSHDGTSSYQMLAGVFRFVCANGLVIGDATQDIRVRHSGDVVGQVVEGAFTVLKNFDQIDAQRENMQSLELSSAEQDVFASSALALKYDETAGALPITPSQVLYPRRADDRGGDLWTVFNRVQENIVRGGMRGRSATGRNFQTRPVTGIDQGIKLNRALWVLADGMRKLKA
jgi:Domain of unknown function (DUF932)